MDRKRLFKRLLIALLLALLGVEAYMENRYSCMEGAVTSEDPAAIFRQAPEAELTETDRAFLEDVLQCESTVALLESGETGGLDAEEQPDLQTAAERYLSAEEAGTLSLSVMVLNQETYLDKGTAVFVNWERGQERFFIQKLIWEDGEEYYKLYAPRQTLFYESWNDGRARKTEVRRRWFAWLRDGLWREE